MYPEVWVPRDQLKRSRAVLDTNRRPCPSTSRTPKIVYSARSQPEPVVEVTNDGEDNAATVITRADRLDDASPARGIRVVDASGPHLPDLWAGNLGAALLGGTVMLIMSSILEWLIHRYVYH
jgi:hypothetical protein